MVMLYLLLFALFAHELIKVCLFIVEFRLVILKSLLFIFRLVSMFILQVK